MLFVFMRRDLNDFKSRSHTPKLYGTSYQNKYTTFTEISVLCPLKYLYGLSFEYLEIQSLFENLRV